MQLTSMICLRTWRPVLSRPSSSPPTDLAALNCTALALRYRRDESVGEVVLVWSLAEPSSARPGAG
jgi:hypothetical protein